jgi:hypothetical protein
VAVITQYPLSDDTTQDLLYSILLKMGGTIADIEEKFFDSRDDLLYAILKKTGTGGAGGADDRIYYLLHSDSSRDLPADTAVTHILIDSDTDLPAFSIGSTNNGGEIQPAIHIQANQPQMISNAFYAKMITTLYYNGIAAGGSQLYNASRSADVTVIDWHNSNISDIYFDVFAGTHFSKNGQPATIFTYLDAAAINLTLGLNLQGTYNASGCFLTIRIRKNNVIVATKVLGDTGGINIGWSWIQDLIFATVQNDAYEIEVVTSDSSLGKTYQLIAQTGAAVNFSTAGGSAANVGITLISF